MCISKSCLLVVGQDFVGMAWGAFYSSYFVPHISQQFARKELVNKETIVECMCVMALLHCCHPQSKMIIYHLFYKKKDIITKEIIYNVL